MSLTLWATIAVVLVGLALGVWEFLRQRVDPGLEEQLKRDERQRRFYASVLKSLRERSRTGASGIPKPQKRRPDPKGPSRR